MITSEQNESLRSWFAEHLPEDLFASLVEVVADPEEITVVGSLPEPPRAQDAPAAGQQSQQTQQSSKDAHVQEFRARSRDDRVAVAREAERRFGRKVSWGVEYDGERYLFRHVAAPVMTRLRQPERLVLDTLIAGGVARSRSDALAWCVRLVQRHSDAWLGELRESLEHVQRVRAQGPDASDPAKSPKSDRD